MKKPAIRFWIGTMVFFTTFTNYMLRSNMPVSVIKMVDRGEKNFTPFCLIGKQVNKTSKGSNKTKIETFKWNENEVAMVIGSYFWGYIITVMPGGILSELLGPWHVIFWSSLVSGILTALTPISASVGGVIGVCVNRFLVGALGGVAYPAVNVLIAKWAPPKEKGKFLAAMMGNTLGTVITLNLVGWTTSAYGWPWGFYSLVILMGAFCLAFGLLVRDSPDKHPWISEEEKTYIKECQEGHVSNIKKIPPYWKILKSRAFWVTTAAQFGNLWGLNLILSYAPKYMAETLGFNLKASAGLAALPYLGRLICSSIFGVIGDWMRKKDMMSVTKIRKFFIIFSHYIPAVCLFMIRVAGCNAGFVVALLVLNQSFNGAVVVSHLITPQDMAPNFAGTVYGMMNLVGMTTGIFVPMISGCIMEYYNMTLDASTVICTIGGAVFVAGGVIFMILGVATVQPWNEIKAPEEPKT